jgi:hypothetical protein
MLTTVSLLQTGSYTMLPIADKGSAPGAGSVVVWKECWWVEGTCLHYSTTSAGRKRVPVSVASQLLVFEMRLSRRIAASSGVL